VSGRPCKQFRDFPEEARAPRYPCARCGVLVEEWSAICTDCRQVTGDLGERGRWRSDYSKAMRRRIMRRLHSRTPWDTPAPYRDSIQPYRAPVEGAWDEWADSAHQITLPPPGSHITHRREHP
jgi:hypothetical protein